MPTYFTIVLRNDDIQEFDSKWDEISLSTTKIPSDDILESLYKLRIRESEKLKTVLELDNMEIHQKKAGPDYHRLKTMVKRSIEQDVRNKNLAPGMDIMKETPWSRIREQNSVCKKNLCWHWESNGQCSRGDNCSFRHDVNKRGKMTHSNTSPKFFHATE